MYPQSMVSFVELYFPPSVYKLKTFDEETCRDLFVMDANKFYVLMLRHFVRFVRCVYMILKKDQTFIALSITLPAYAKNYLQAYWRNLNNFHYQQICVEFI